MTMQGLITFVIVPFTVYFYGARAPAFLRTKELLSFKPQRTKS